MAITEITNWIEGETEISIGKVNPGKTNKKNRASEKIAGSASEDKLYVVSGQGCSSSGMIGDGSELTQTISDQVTNMFNGEENVETMKIEVAMSCHYSPSKITVIQMNEKEQVVRTDEYIGRA